MKPGDKVKCVNWPVGKTRFFDDAKTGLTYIVEREPACGCCVQLEGIPYPQPKEAFRVVSRLPEYYTVTSLSPPTARPSWAKKYKTQEEAEVAARGHVEKHNKSFCVSKVVLCFEPVEVEELKTVVEKKIIARGVK